MRFKTVRQLVVFFLCLLFMTGTAAQRGKFVFYVASNGKLGNPGTLDKPFQRPEQALEAVRNIKGPLDAIIYIRGGIYTFSKSLVITDGSGGTDRHLLISGWQNEKVVFSGGQKLNNDKFAPVSNPTILDRLPVVARGKVLAMDLKASGVTDYGKRAPHGFKVVRTAPLELFYNGNVLTVARYPNEGYLPIGNVLDPGSNPRQGDRSGKGATFAFTDSRMKNWTHAANAWVGGYFSYGYSDDYLKVDSFNTANQTIRLAQPALYSVFSTDNTSNDMLKNAQNIRGFYVYNLLEEIDQPGEWFLDEPAGVLYVWPPQGITPVTDFEVSILEAPIVVLSGATNVQLNNISFAYARGIGLLIENTKNVEITHCGFSDLGTVGISTGNQLVDKKVSYTSAGAAADPGYNTNLLIQSCVINNTGTGGVLLDGGDRKTLTPANNVLDNTEIYNYSRINRTFSPAVALNGVSNKITHCYIHDAPDQAILFYGDDLTIAYNHIAKVTSYMTDAGAVGTGRDIGTTGNTVDYNFFDNITSTIGSSLCALYLDDGTSGTEVDGNIFYKAGTGGSYHFGAVHVNGGSDNTFRNNYFIDCPQAFSNTQWKDQQWKNVISDPGIAKVYRPGVDLHADVYKQKYPWLERLTDTNHLANRMNYTYNTLAYKVGIFSAGAGYTHKNPLVTQTDPGFANSVNGDFTLSKAPPAFQQAGDWKPAPFKEIGLRTN